jgi:hypothetical protein
MMLRESIRTKVRLVPAHFVGVRCLDGRRKPRV